MSDRKQDEQCHEEKEPLQKPDGSVLRSIRRRSFLKGAGGVATTAALVTLKPLIGGKGSQAEAEVDIPTNNNARAQASLKIRTSVAQSEDVKITIPDSNGDFALYPDRSGNFSKTLAHDSLGIVNAASFSSLVTALGSEKFSDFQNVIVGNPGGTNSNAQLNGPQTSLAFDLEGLDSHAANAIGSAPPVASAQTADEQVEHYWGALLRDVNFTDYPSNSLAQAAAAELNSLTYISSKSNDQYPFPVTPQNLFRGQIVPNDGNVQGPYLSQFLLQPAFFSNLPITQQYSTFPPGQDFMTNVSEFLNVQNGFEPTGKLAFDPTLRYIRNGRDLAALSHADLPPNEYIVAMLILAAINAPLNPGNPYGTKQGVGTKSEHGFGTLDSIDCVTTLTEMATRALKAAWYHKWIVNLRLRPEEYGALVQTRLTSASQLPLAAAALHADVLQSQALKMTFDQFGTYLLPQAFPEGCPTHPCYPTGHGTVAGACITAIKFFFDGSQPIQPLLQAAGSDVKVPSEDGTSLVTYTGSDAGDLTINGELSKLAFNISFGHGIHAGIHFRSSTNASILLGEQVAVSVLQDRAATYNEPFTINITTLAGKKNTFTNAGNP